MTRAAIRSPGFSREICSLPAESGCIIGKDICINRPLNLQTVQREIREMKVFQLGKTGRFPAKSCLLHYASACLDLNIYFVKSTGYAGLKRLCFERTLVERHIQFHFTLTQFHSAGNFRNVQFFIHQFADFRLHKRLAADLTLLCFQI